MADEQTSPHNLIHGPIHDLGASAQPYFIAVDLGTSRIKAAALDSTGRSLAHAARPCALSRPQAGWAEMDLDRVLRDTLDALRECVQKAALPPAQIAALALTGQGDGSRLVDEHGSSLRPAIIWQDGRAVSIIRRWHRDGRAREVMRLTGAVLSGSHQTAQLAWLAQHEPDVVKRARHIFFAKDWLFFHLTGVVGTDQSDSSYTYLNWRTRQRDPEILNLLDLAWISAKLPEVLEPGRAHARLLAPMAAATGLPAGLPVVLAPFDVVAEMVGVGGFAAGVASSVMGTAGIHQVSLEPPVGALPDDLAGCTTYIPGQPTIIRFIPNMLAVPNIEFWAAMLYPDLPAPPSGYTGSAVLESRLSQIPPGAEGVLYLPFLSPAGERAPRFSPEAHAAFTGLSLDHRREHLLRAVYEGVALAAADSFANLPFTAASVRMTGGGARSPLLAQILADVLERPVEVCADPDGAVRGAALFAQVALGYAPDFATAYRRLNLGWQTFTPEPGASLAYRALKTAYLTRVLLDQTALS